MLAVLLKVSGSVLGSRFWNLEAYGEGGRILFYGFRVIWGLVFFLYEALGFRILGLVFLCGFRGMDRDFEST